MWGNKTLINVVDGGMMKDEEFVNRLKLKLLKPDDSKLFNSLLVANILLLTIITILH